uniref:Uncharacterized protein n=1 Tax=Anguilla anguilla TaxID=7936 RepID=A0A0E9QC99_ANGAN
MIIINNTFILYSAFHELKDALMHDTWVLMAHKSVTEMQV